MSAIIEYGIYLICIGIATYFLCCGFAKIIRAFNGDKN